VNLLDFLVTHQAALFGVIAGAVTGALAARQWRLFDVVIAKLRRSNGGEASDAADTIKKHALNVIALSTVFLLMGILIGRSEPIPKTAALDLPKIAVRAEANKRLLIFLHGWYGDTEDTWKVFPDLARHDPRFESFNVLPIAYPTFLIRRNLSIKQMAHWLNEEMVRDGDYRQYDEIWVIAHSMGGLIAREMLLDNRLRQDNKQYKGLIEIATPHQGANMAKLLVALGLSSGFSDDLSPGSPMLGDLRDSWNSLKDRPKTYCLTSPHDSVVTQDSAIFQCDEFLRYPQWGHIDMVKPLNRTDDRYGVPMARILAVQQPDEPTPPTPTVMQAQWAISLSLPDGWSKIWDVDDAGLHMRACDCLEPVALPQFPFPPETSLEFRNKCGRTVEAFISKTNQFGTGSGLKQGARLTVPSMSVFKADLSGARGFAIYLKQCPS
jgi:pimeloyl-ACP methyl ester carboxylesterase